MVENSRSPDDSICAANAASGGTASFGASVRRAGNEPPSASRRSSRPARASSAAQARSRLAEVERELHLIERETEQADAAGVLAGDLIEQHVEMRVVGLHHMVEQRQIHALDPRHHPRNGDEQKHGRKASFGCRRGVC